MKIRTTNVCPPIPDRSCDWSAVDDDTYEGGEESNCPIGYGPTERDAINDLVQQMVDNAYDNGFRDGEMIRAGEVQFLADNPLEDRT